MCAWQIKLAVAEKPFPATRSSARRFTTVLLMALRLVSINEKSLATKASILAKTPASHALKDVVRRVGSSSDFVSLTALHCLQTYLPIDASAKHKTCTYEDGTAIVQPDAWL